MSPLFRRSALFGDGAAGHVERSAAALLPYCANVFGQVK
jgi:hypothetical protein